MVRLLFHLISLSLHNLRLGYGYAALPEVTKGIALPKTTAVWKMDIETGEVVDL